MTFLKENAKNCVKSLLFCRFVRVITHFDKEKEVFRLNLPSLTKEKHRVENLNNLYKTRTTYKKTKRRKELEEPKNKP